MQRSAATDRGGRGSPRPGDDVSGHVDDVVRASGQPLDRATRVFMESRFGQDFGGVRVHTGARASDSARELGALAYTVGRDVVFRSGAYAPGSSAGRQLLAHELTHVVQQGGEAYTPSGGPLPLDPPHGAAEGEARRAAGEVGAGRTPAGGGVRAAAPSVARADPDAVALTMNLGRTPRTGLQFWPTAVTDTQVGPVTVRGGLLDGGASRLNVIVGENLTLHTLAREIRPLWITATPFTPAGAAAPLPLDIVTEEELARGLLVYNQTYLPVPAMTRWRAGLRFPLPVQVDEATGMATLHPLQIRALAGAFDPAWVPLLDLRAPGTVAPAAAVLQAETAAFLARETTAQARGIHLGARALTNAVAELPFVREAFVQLGAAASFDVALAFMDFLVQREVDLLLNQRDGDAILVLVQNALAAAPPGLDPARQASQQRALMMLMFVGGGMGQAPPGATRNRAEKTITIDTIRLQGSTHNPATEVAIAAAILAQCNIRLVHGLDQTASPVETTTWLGGNTDLRAAPSCGTTTGEERAMVAGAAAAPHNLSARFRAYYPATFSGLSARAYSVHPSCATGSAAQMRNSAVIQNTATERTLAHELGHILLNGGAHTGAASGNVMTPTIVAPLSEGITDAQCTTMHGNA
ncbi:MAG TPA: DUF4157 domain-containing protein [Longimicrobiaceae bacterium]